MMLASSVSSPAIISFAIYLFVVFLLALPANRAQQGKSFVGEYFLGSRSFGDAIGPDRQQKDGNGINAERHQC